jgi:hypothetical protein
MFKLDENQRALLLTIAFLVGTAALIYGATYFAGILGLTAAEGGIYADCAKPENRSNPYCQPKESSSERDWKSLRGKGQHVPFSLTDR